MARPNGMTTPELAAGLSRAAATSTDLAVGYVSALGDFEKDLYRDVALLIVTRCGLGLAQFGVAIEGIAVAMPEGMEMPEVLPREIVGAQAALAQIEAKRDPRAPKNVAVPFATDDPDSAAYVRGWWTQVFATQVWVDGYEWEQRQQADIANQN